MTASRARVLRAGGLALAVAFSISSSGKTEGDAQRSYSPGSPRVSPVHVRWTSTKALRDGVDLWAGGAWREALEKFRLAVRTVPTDPVAWHNFGVALFFAGDFPNALAAFENERFLTPSAPSALFGMGRCRLAMGEPDRAEGDFVLALTFAPLEWEYWLALSDALLAQGEREAAARAEQNAVRLRPRAQRRPVSYAEARRAVLHLKFPPRPAFAGTAPSGFRIGMRKPASSSHALPASSAASATTVSPEEPVTRPTAP